MPAMIKVPFEHLICFHHEIGTHRDRQWGFREVFGFSTLQGLPFLRLAIKVKRAYEGKDVPSHEGWPAQREALRWLVDRGRDAIYAIDEKGLALRTSPIRGYFITDGNHRALALYILGETVARGHLGQIAIASRRTRS